MEMSDRADLAQMGEPELRAWLQKLPAEELIEVIVGYVRAFLRDGVDEFGASGGALGSLLEMNFAAIISYLKENTRLPELSRLRVEGDEVKYQTAAGSDILINATGLQDGPGLPGVGRFARSTPDPNQTLRPRPAEAATPGVSTEEAPPRPAPRRGGGLFDEGASGSGISGGDEPRARRLAPAPGPARPAEPPRVKPGESPRVGSPAKGPGPADKKATDKKGPGKKDDRFSALEFD
jgi:hypothetical protein